MDSTKKKSSKRTPVESSQEELSTSTPITTTSKPKKTSTKTGSKKKAAAASQDLMETESEVESSQTTTTTTTTTSASASSLNGTSSITSSIPTTPISKYIPSLSQMGTPLSPNRAAQRLREKDDLSAIHHKLQTSLKKLQSTENELERKTRELEEVEFNHETTINALKSRSDAFERQLSEELMTRSDLVSARDHLESELKTKEATWKKDKEEYLTKLTDTINKLNQEHSVATSGLKSELLAKEFEMETMKNEINRLKDELQYRIREGEEKSRKLLDNEYSRMKQKEEEYNQVLLSKDEEIKKYKLELKEKEKSSNASSRKENELNQLIQAHDRQIEDIRDSINREWEVKAAQMMEEHHSRTIHLEQSVEQFNDERERFKSQIETFNAQIEDLNIKNNEFEDKIKELNNVITQKDGLISDLTSEIEEGKKRLRKQTADLKSKDSQISLLQVENNNRETKTNSYLSEINRLKSEIYAINSQVDPEIYLTKEIESLKELANGFEKSVNEKDRKRKRSRFDEEIRAAGGDQAMNTDDQSTTSAGNGVADSAVNGVIPGGPEQLETFNPNTVNFSVVDSTQEFIKLSVHGDYDTGLSLSKYRLIVVKPNGLKAGFSFPEGIAPLRGIKTVTVWTGRPRPQNVSTSENEFFWNRTELWTSPVEGTDVKLVSPTEVTTTIKLPASGIYERDLNSNGKSNCLIM